MAIPASFTNVEIDTTFIDLHGRPRSGTVSFAYPVHMYSGDRNTVITAGTSVYPLDQNGRLRTSILATNDPDIQANEFYVTVTERLDAVPATKDLLEVPETYSVYQVAVPHDIEQPASLLDLPRGPAVVSGIESSTIPPTTPLFASVEALNSAVAAERAARLRANYLTGDDARSAVSNVAGSMVLAHENAIDPHPAYMTETEIRTLVSAGVGNSGTVAYTLNRGSVAVGDLLPGGAVLLGAYQTYDLHADTPPTGSDLRIVVRRARDGADLALLSLPNGASDTRARITLSQPIGTRVRFVCLDAGSTRPAADVSVSLYTSALPLPNETLPGGTSSPLPATPPEPPAGTTVVNINDSVMGTGVEQWQESGSWINVDTAGAWGNNERRTAEAGATRTLKFKGRGVRIHSSRGPGHGQFSVQIDGGDATVVNLYSETTAIDQLVYWSALLPDAEHIVRITCIGGKDPRSSGTGIGIDRAIVFSTVAAATDPTSPTNPVATGFVKRTGDSLYLNDQRWWFTGYNSRTWSQDIGSAEEVAAMTNVALDAWFDGMRKDGHGLVRLFFLSGWSYGKLDHAIAAAKRNNVYLMVTLDDAQAAGRTADWYADPAARDRYRAHLVSVLRRYKNETRIAVFEYMSAPTEAAAYRSFIDDVGATARMEDPNHLWASGAVAPYWFGDNEASLNNTNYRYVHESPYVDIATMHEWDESELVSNHLDNVIANCSGKPVVVANFAIRASEATTTACAYTFTTRAPQLQKKLAGYLTGNRVSAALAWAWQPGNGGAFCEAENLDTDTLSQTELKNFIA